MYSLKQAGCINTDAHANLEVILQHYVLNKPENLNKTEPDGAVLHLINLTGFSGNTYFDPVPLTDLSFRIRLDFRPSELYAMKKGNSIPFTWKDGRIGFILPTLDEFEGIIMDKEVGLP
jgi:hypothetical protein